MAAVATGNESRVHELLKAGVNPNDPTGSRSPLILAIASFNPEVSSALTCNAKIVKLLLGYGADPNRPDPRIGALPLLTAFDVGDMQCARMIKAAGGQTGAHANGRTLLMSAVGSAARHKDMSILDVAIGWGGSVNERSVAPAPDGGATALHEAVRINSAEVAKALLARAADPCIRNDIGQTPLDMAVNLKRSETLIRVLRSATRCK